MNKYILQCVSTKGGLKLQVRKNGRFLCSLHLHKYYSRAFCVTSFDIEVQTDAASEFWSDLSDKMRALIKRHLTYEEDVWNYKFAIYSR